MPHNRVDVCGYTVQVGAISIVEQGSGVNGFRSNFEMTFLISSLCAWGIGCARNLCVGQCPHHWDLLAGRFVSLRVVFLGIRVNQKASLSS